METINLILSIIASIAGIVAAIISWITKNEVQKITKNSNNHQAIGNNSSNNRQNMSHRGR